MIENEFEKKVYFWTHQVQATAVATYRSYMWTACKVTCSVKSPDRDEYRPGRVVANCSGCNLQLSVKQDTVIVNSFEGLGAKHSLTRTAATP